MTKKRTRRRTKRKRGSVVPVLIVFIMGILCLVSVRLFTTSFEQPKATTVEDPTKLAHTKFIKQIAPTAQEMQTTYHVLPSITIAQAILESDWGTSGLASRYYNLFGVKANDNNSVTLSTQEFVGGSYQTVKAQFQVYSSWRESIIDHDRLLAEGTKWNANQYADVIAATNYIDGAKALQQDGYATDPAYTQKLISIIQKYHLYQYD
ncbi:glycoside hydrolase family 73 protein [Lentilactobacillus senioris]|uniref:glycoside hydrolase family 73 protein n=1 Tax=Lentilactobacillus senioris TaxID=931534 RepID=UPI003D2B73E1